MPAQAMSGRSEIARHWRLLIGASLGMSVGVTGILPYTLGVLLPHFTADFGWARAQVGFGQSLQSYGAALAAPLAGWVVDRIGLRRPATMGLLAFAALLVVLALNRGSLAGLWITMTLMGFSAAFCGPLVFTRAVNLKFDAARGLALGLVLGCVGIGAFLYPVLMAQLVERHGWRSSLCALAAWIALATPVVILLLVPGIAASPSTIPAGPFQMPAWPWRLIWRSAIFWRLAVAFPLAAAALSGYLLHTVPLLRGAGLSALQAATLQGLLGPSITVSRLLSASLADYVSAPRLTALCMLAAACGAMALAEMGPAAAVVAIPLLGVGFGCEVDLMSYMIARYFPLRSYGRVYGIVYAGALLGAGTGPVWLGAVFDHHGSYLPGLWLTAVALVLAALLFLTAPPMAKRVAA